MAHFRRDSGSREAKYSSLYIDKFIDELIENVDTYICSSQDFDKLMAFIQQLDAFVASLPISKDDELSEIVSKVPIRDKWYGGYSIKEIEKLNEKASDVCTQYYGFHFPWIINAIAKKMNILGNVDEAKVLEEISLFSEIGVYDIKSAKIYLSGIKSCECAMELAALIVTDDDLATPVKDQLMDYYDLLESGQTECSEKAYRWLKLLNINEGRVARRIIKKENSSC